MSGAFWRWCSRPRLWRPHRMERGRSLFNPGILGSFQNESLPSLETRPRTNRWKHTSTSRWRRERSDFSTSIQILMWISVCSTTTSTSVPGPTYVALSYCWGDQDDTLPVTIGGKKVEITKNLWTALRLIGPCLRERNESSDSRYSLWVDQICIDQRNLQERNQQVHCMW